MSNPFYPYGYGYGHGAAGDGAGAGGYSSYEIDLIAARYGGGPLADPSSARAFDAHFGAPMRSAEVLYHQPIMGSRRTIGEIEALYSSNTMAKRPRLESSLPIYPQRPGAKQCTFYMTTRTCKYGDTCKFDHPQWVPEGGIPDWKEVPKLEDSVLRKKLEESYPERAGEPDCPYFMKTKKCRFGSKCRFNHPKEKANELVPETGNEQESLIDVGHVFPVRPSEPLCSFYAKTGKCKFGVNCKFNHPKDIEIPSSQNNSEDTASVEAAEHIGTVDGSVLPKLFTPIAAAAKFNSKGLPIRPGEVDCAFYMRAGSCKYSTDCRFNHPEPDRPVLNFPLAVPLDPTIIPTVETMVLNPAANFMPNFDFHVPHIPAEPEPVTYPQRPGETVCDFYMKTGHCKFSERCKFHHPIDRSAPPAALPRREDAEACAHYMKTGACKFGMKCKFDHPSDQETVAKASGAGS